MNYPRGTISALLIGAATLLTGCGTTHIEDTSPAAGNPRIVASDVTVKVTPLASATSPGGGRVERQNIIGQVVMTRQWYDVMLNDIRVLGVVAAQCMKVPACRDAALAEVEQ